MKNISGEDLVALAASLSIKLSDDADIEELITLIEFIGLLKHNLEIIKCKKVVKKIEKKIEDKKDKD